MKYVKCHICGANLDHGERCDCHKTTETEALLYCYCDVCGGAILEGETFYLSPGMYVPVCAKCIDKAKRTAGYDQSARGA